MSDDLTKYELAIATGFYTDKNAEETIKRLIEIVRSGRTGKRQKTGFCLSCRKETDHDQIHVHKPL